MKKPSLILNAICSLIFLSFAPAHAESKNREMKLVTKVETKLLQAAISPNGDRLAVLSSDGLTLRHTRNGNVIRHLELPAHSAAGLEFSHDGSDLVVGMNSGSLNVFNGHTGEKRRVILESVTGEKLRFFALSPREKKLVIVLETNKAIVYDFDKDRTIKTHENIPSSADMNDLVGQVEFSPNGDKFALFTKYTAPTSLDWFGGMSQSATIGIFETATGDALNSFVISKEPVHSFYFPGNDNLAILSFKFKLFLISNGEMIWDYSNVETVAWTADEKSIFVARDNNMGIINGYQAMVRRHDLDKNQDNPLVYLFESQDQSMTAIRDRFGMQMRVSSRNTDMIFFSEDYIKGDLMRNKLVRFDISDNKMTAMEKFELGEAPTRAYFSDNGSFLVLENQDKQVRVYEIP